MVYQGCSGRSHLPRTMRQVECRYLLEIPIHFHFKEVTVHQSVLQLPKISLPTPGTVRAPPLDGHRGNIRIQIRNLEHPANHLQNRIHSTARYERAFGDALETATHLQRRGHTATLPSPSTGEGQGVGDQGTAIAHRVKICTIRSKTPSMFRSTSVSRNRNTSKPCNFRTDLMQQPKMREPLVTPSKQQPNSSAGIIQQFFPPPRRGRARVGVIKAQPLLIA
jgi:hypothetical protein